MYTINNNCRDLFVLKKNVFENFPSFRHFPTSLLLIRNKKKNSTFLLKKMFHKISTKIQYTTLTAANHLSTLRKYQNHDCINLIKGDVTSCNIWLSYKERIRIDKFDKADLICQDYAQLLPQWVWAMATRHVFCELNKLCASDCVTACQCTQAFGYCRVFWDCLSSLSLSLSFSDQRWNPKVESLPNNTCMYV